MSTAAASYFVQRGPQLLGQTVVVIGGSAGYQCLIIPTIPFLRSVRFRRKKTWQIPFWSPARPAASAR
jgi:hypothetical protein